MAETDCENGHDMCEAEDDIYGTLYRCRNCTYYDYISKPRET